PLPGRLPDPVKIKGSVKLQCGKDDLAALQPEDLIGDPASDVKRGLRTIEDVPDVAIVALPDLTIQPIPVVQTVPPSGPPPNPCLPVQGPLPVAGPPEVQATEQPPGFSLDQVFQVQQAMIDFCELQKRCIAILDPPVQASG